MHIALLTCVTTRAILSKLYKDLNTAKLNLALKEFVAKRGTPS